MPTLLSIDATSDTCSVALSTSHGIKQLISDTAREHTQRLLPMVDGLLDGDNIALDQLDAIVYGCGPGSFTGLRICLSIAQGLAYGQNLPLIAVSSLETMAKGAVRLKQLSNCLVVPVIDARMDEVYWAAYTVDAQGQITEVLSQQVSTPEECYQNIIKLPYPVIHGVGSGWHYSTLNGMDSASVDIDLSPLAYDMLELVLADYKESQFLKPTEAVPTYLRNEISWQKRKRIRST